ncbi:hypothetical protein [uncultured Algibacter sp.]|uniref:hypothetical protein n=1 Tax=uncultured Algibacter sp. TaxID=298659 RepID=UPI002614E637|nr:hypothetical protein [uncultured Algibacter sp.]
MKPLFKCELNYFPSLHLSQIYDGFEKLKKLGIIDLSVKTFTGNANIPILKVVIDNKYTVIYDTLDGFNWIKGSVQENLQYFKDHMNVDYYFKRSYNKQILDYKPNNCKVYPLGLNIGIQPEGKFKKGLIENSKDFIKNNYIISKFYKKTFFYSKDFEFFPIPHKNTKILFITRLWDPNSETLNHLKTERELINKNRVRCINVCKKEFGKQFTGGLQKDFFSIKYSNDLIMPSSLTNRESFLKTIREHNICISTSGLHNSIGWKFGEYVAASRAIISEPLIYKPSGNFENTKNYLTFNNEDELMNQTHFLLKNKELLSDMMNRNYKYYNDYMRPDKLVLNTLLQIYEND